MGGPRANDGVHDGESTLPRDAAKADDAATPVALAQLPADRLRADLVRMERAAAWRTSLLRAELLKVQSERDALEQELRSARFPAEASAGARIAATAGLASRLTHAAAAVSARACDAGMSGAANPPDATSMTGQAGMAPLLDEAAGELRLAAQRLGESDAYATKLEECLFDALVEVHAGRRAEVEARRNELAALQGSVRWRALASLRALAARLRGGAASPDPTPWSYETPASITERIAAIRRARSWRLGAALGLPEFRHRGEAALCAAGGRKHRASGKGPLLVAADMMPPFDMHSGGLRLLTLVELMAKERPVVFGSIAEAEWYAGLPGGRDRHLYEAALRAAGVQRILFGTAEIEGFIGDLAQELDSAFLSFPATAEALIPPLRAFRPEARILYDMVDFHALRLARQARLAQDIAGLDAAAQSQVRELANCRAADVTIAISDQEREAVARECPDAHVHVLPNLHRIPPGPPPGPDARRGLLFVGGFWHQPNVDAVLWFTREIWPRLLEAAPELDFTVAGSNPPAGILALGGQRNIRVLPDVPDLAPLFAAARVLVAPLRFGAGIKGKVTQSMALGLPVVATPVGAEGIPGAPSGALLVADTPEDFARAVIELHQDQVLWLRQQEEALSVVRRHFSVEAVSLRLRELLDG